VGLTLVELSAGETLVGVGVELGVGVGVGIGVGVGVETVLSSATVPITVGPLKYIITRHKKLSKPNEVVDELCFIRRGHLHLPISTIFLAPLRIGLFLVVGHR